MINNLLNEISNREDIQVIVFDGFSGSGKTTIANQVAEHIGGLAVDTDDYVDDPDSVATYIERLNLDHLKAAIELAINNGTKVCLSGICIQNIC
ncbi:hypothetical protein Q8W40_27970 [Vibrio penaeicida]|uniref:NB-ARC domain-containing protein n=1 Tax=Vibrio penaeicida TaxID=104609 RepID=UPI0027344641|nr:NB-ARC domain-containing protein [Vibrio penaeicida]MDP2576040.1 hypothetical protein [Vibrio penaeicida]